jgi:hypothetical protein
MSQAGFTPIQLYFSTTAAATPSAGNLANGELAINITDGRLFYKDNGGVVQTLATKSSAISPVTNNGVVYVNSSGQATTGSALTFDGTSLAVPSGNLAVGATSTSARLQATSAPGSVQFRWTDATNGTANLDTASGVSRIWSNVALAFGTNSESFSEQMRLTSTGLGIGTSSPAVKLQVAGGISLSSANNLTWGGAYGAGIPTLTADGTNGFQFYPGGSTSGESMRLTSAGNLGIGTISPGSKLDIAGSGTAGMTTLQTIRTSSGNSTGFQIRGNFTNEEYLIQNFYSAALAFGTNNTERARITSSGNFGIGTSSPGATIQVLGLNTLPTGSRNLKGWIGGASSWGADSFEELGVGYSGIRSIYTGGADWALTFATGTSSQFSAGTQAERARIDASGNLLVGTTTTPVAGYNCFAENGADVQLILQRLGSGAGYGGIGASGDSAFFVYGSTGTLSQRFQVTQAGSCFNTTGTYGTLSDIKIKENIQDARDYLEDLCKVRIIKYSLKADAKTAPDKLGVVAQELEQIFPNMIEEQPDVINGKEMAGTTTKTVKYSVFVPMLIKAIQEQQVLIQTLTARVQALESN